MGKRGVRVQATRTSIGGLTAEAGNVIAYNGADGVIIDSGDGNAVQRNSIVGSTGLGIALINNGNQLQESPSLLHAFWAPSSINVAGALISDALTSFAIEFF